MAYVKQTWDTTSYVNPTRMNYIENGIAGNKFKEIGSISPNSNEKWDSLIGRVRDAYFTTGSQFGQLKLTVDSTNNLIFVPNRFSSAEVTQWFGIRGTAQGFVAYIITTSASSASIRKYTCTASGITVSDISSSNAEGAITVYGFENN